MNISYNWLRSLAPTVAETPQRLAERLGMLGAPVDELVEIGAGLGDILIARVTDVRPHPNADRLRVCTVDAGGEPLQVVCGAPNVEAGGFYPFAPIGARLPDGMEIRKAKLRGESSEGMLCSARELGLGRDHAGLLALAGEWRPGSSFLTELGLDDVRLVLDITANRPDLLSHVGVAREVAPGGEGGLQLPPFPGSSAISTDLVEGGAELSAGGISISIEDAAECPRYMAMVVDGVRVRPSPEWLASRLRAAGLRPINNVVDATNYVLHEVGQPLHAFDLDKLGTEIRVRRAGAGESLRTLDGIDRKLDHGALVIADGSRPVALAGVMGGEDTEVTAGTTRILVECALFDPLRVRMTARSLGMSTDASHRFERGVDPRLQPRALTRVVELIVAIAGGAPLGPALDAHPAPPRPLSLRVRPTRVRAVLGVEIGVDEILELLRPIGFNGQADGDAVVIEVPTFRPDVTREIDVIEEIARRRGYDSFEAEISPFRPGVVPTDPQVPLQHRVHAQLARYGFLEARTVAFAPASETRVPLLNPLSSEESHLRDDLLTGLLRRVEHNWAHGVRAIRLYEIGSVFAPSGAEIPNEEIRLAAVLTGARRPAHWSEPTAPADLWDLKGLMEELADQLRLRLSVEPARSSLLVAGESLSLVDADGRVIGLGGRIDPKTVDAPAWADPVWGVEVRLQPKDRATSTYQPLPTVPGAERDLALIVPLGVTATDTERVIRSRASDLLHSVWPFDLYEGKGIPEGTRSVAWRLKFLHPERTLTDEEVEAEIRGILKGLEQELDVRRR